MADMITVKEAAVRWNLAERTITGLCRNGRIPGAVKNGRNWKVPENAEKPVDSRVTSGKYIQKGRGKRLPLPVGVSDYRLATTEYYYVDKTMMIKDLIDERPMVTLFTRPRRFGKTLNMDMIRTFFEKTDEDTAKYFVNKKIWSCGQNYRNFQGRYPVIFLTLKDVKQKNWSETFEYVGLIIADEYARHSELRSSDALDVYEKEFYEKIVSKRATNVELAQSLFRLSMLMKKHYGESAVIIIDEYDTPIQSGHTNGFYDEVISFMRNLLSGCFKDNRNLAFGLLTGILRVAKESIFSGLNNLIINSVLDSKYSEYFGFTADEVREMAAYYGVADKFGEICEWYDGYRFGKNEIFNPWSVISYFGNNSEPRAFWLSTGSNEIIGEVLKEADEDIYNKLTALVKGDTFTTYIDTCVIYPQIRNNPSSIFSFLLMAGYLKILKASISVSGDFICDAVLPNKEITFVYRKEILRQLDYMIPQSTATAVEESLLTGSGEKLRNIIDRLLVQSISSFDTAGENFYHGFMLGICALFGNFYVTSNRESGDGRFDIQLAPKTGNIPGIIIELKAEKNCSEKELKVLAAAALEQINAKKYDAEMRGHGVRTIYKYGVAFSGKRVEVAVGE